MKLTCFCQHEATLFVISYKMTQILAILNAHHTRKKLRCFDDEMLRFVDPKQLYGCMSSWRNNKMHNVEEIQCLRCCRQEKNYGAVLMMTCWDVSTSAFQCDKNNECDTKSVHLMLARNFKQKLNARLKLQTDTLSQKFNVHSRPKIREGCTFVLTLLILSLALSPYVV